MKQWHWVSAAISLVGMLLFAITGITLNHAAQIEVSPRVKRIEVQLPADMVPLLKPQPASTKAPVPENIAGWIHGKIAVDVRKLQAEWSESEVYVAKPRPGGDAWLTIDRESGDIAFEDTDRGWIAYLNDLHKGRHAGVAWSLFLDVFAAACIVFCVTGLVLLKIYAVGRPSTWYMVGLGLALPVVLLLVFVH